MNVNLNKKNDTEIRYFLEYYQRVFAKLHVELYESGYSVDASHHIRSRYWRLVPDGKYSSIRSVELANQYLKIVEEEIKNNISEHSLCYWLHLYRRLRPGPIGPDTRPMTIGYVRLVLEASFQKYAIFSFCDRISLSNDIPVHKILNGLLMKPDFKLERKAVKDKPQSSIDKFWGI